MTAPFGHEELWLKARLFIGRSFEAKGQEDFELAAFWAAAALELVGKCALAKVSPLLIADPLDEGRNTMIAAGFHEDAKTYKTVTASTVFKRCAKAFPTFDPRQAELIARAPAKSDFRFSSS